MHTVVKEQLGERHVVPAAPQEAVLSPRAVREADLVEQLWPLGQGSRGVDAPAKPNLALQLAMAPAGAFANFRQGPGGASAWVHVVTGKKVGSIPHAVFPID